MTRRFALLGNCQADGVAACLRAQHPDAEVMALGWNQISSPDQADAVAEKLGGFDGVASQFTQLAEHGDLRSHRLQEHLKGRFQLLPRLHFSGFHPDAIYLSKQLGAVSDFGAFHSLLTLAAFLRGIPRKQVPSLFNAYLYGRLGYFEEFDKAEAFHLAAARKIGLDLAPALARWKALGSFMLAPNHPRVEVMWSIAGSLSQAWGVVPTRDEIPPDPLLAFTVWPVYPEIARRLGVEGSLSFKPTGGLDKAPLSLQQVINRGYRAYGRVDAETLKTPRVSESVAVLKAEGL